MLEGFRQVWKHKKWWLLLYAVTFLAAALLAYPLHRYLNNVLGESLVVGDLVKGFDMNCYTDLTNHYGTGIDVLKHQSIVSLLVYFFVMIFFAGGMSALFLGGAEGCPSNHRSPGDSSPLPSNDREYEGGCFWKNCAAFFGRILRLSACFLVLQILLLLVFYMLYGGITGGGHETERIYSLTMKVILPIYLLMAALLFVWQAFSKLILVRHDKKSVFRAMLDGWRFVCEHPKGTLGLYASYMLVLGLFSIANHFISNSFDITEGGCILLSFLISQIFILGRLGLRLAYQAGAAALVNAAV